MTVYPDTSWYVALRFFDDTHHDTTTEFFAEHGEDLFLWTPWHRVEVSNTLRQFARGDHPVLEGPPAVPMSVACQAKVHTALRAAPRRAPHPANLQFV